MKGKSVALCFVVCMFLAVAQGWASSLGCAANPGNLLVNCGFETGDFTGWTLSGNDVPGELNNLYGVEGTDPLDGISPHSGAYQAYIADLDANATTLSQTIITVPGTLYNVSFYLAQDTAPVAPYENGMLVAFGGTLLDFEIGIPVEGYTRYSWDVNATSTSTTVGITLGNDIGETLIDDAVVARTPEPATWGMLLLGGLVLVLARKHLVPCGDYR
jgi:hypothetical protein